MDIKQVYDKLLENIEKEKIYLDEPMKKHTTFKIGGIADIFLKLDNLEEIKYVLKISKEDNIPIFILGNGSNILVKDGGIRGIVIKLELKEITISKTDENNVKVIAGAGVMLPLLSQKCLKEGITGLEFAVGIPGTIGGAIKMNSGAYGSEMANIVENTRYMDYNGQIHEISNQQHDFEYRNSIFSKTKCIILETTLSLSYGNKDIIKAKMDENILSRKEKQPIEFPSAGSFFKRENDFITAKLIDEAGLKGKKVGGAEVSTKHAGFIINSKDATSKDVMELEKEIIDIVYKKFEKQLQEEVQIIGED